MSIEAVPKPKFRGPSNWYDGTLSDCFEWTRDRKEQLLQMFRDGMSRQDIAKEFGVSPGAVSHQIRVMRHRGYDTGENSSGRMRKMILRAQPPKNADAGKRVEFKTLAPGTPFDEQDVVRAVCCVANITLEEMYGTSAAADITAPRHSAMVLLKELKALSDRNVGRILKRDRSSVTLAADKYKSGHEAIHEICALARAKLGVETPANDGGLAAGTGTLKSIVPAACHSGAA